MKSLRWMFVLTVCLSLILSLGTTSQALQVDGDKKIMVFGGRQPAPNIDPSLKTDWSRRMLQQAFYDGLYKYEGNPAKLVPWLAEKHEVNADATVWTFHLVKNAKFHNGDPVTAAAVKWSFERTLKLKKGISWMLSDLLTTSDIKVIDDHTIQFTLNQPYAPFMSVLPWWYIMNPKTVMAHEKDGDYGQDWLKDNEAGSGPFKKGRWEHGVLYEMVAVPDYWRGWPNENHPDSIIFKLIRETNSLKIGLQKGQLDMVAGLSPDDLDLVAKMPG
ncbi:MAG: ABC transporter substrate-binding protein, partial [Desulfobacterales bacterium]